MSNDGQLTVKSAHRLAGVALHTGEETAVVLRPAPAGAGIVFRRVDHDAQTKALGDEQRLVRAHPANVAGAKLGVTLKNDHGVFVQTVEHLMAALALSGVDNVTVDVEGPEIPILDGSAAPFIRAIRKAGLASLDAPREAYIVRRPVRVEIGDRFVEAVPFDERRIDVSIEFGERAIGRQAISFGVSADNRFVERIGQARTFCAARDIEAMRAAGLAKGGSLENAVVTDGDRILNPGGLRDPDEFVLHKALDLIGDLALAGAPVFGLIRAHKPGHDLNTRLARRIVEDAQACERRAERLLEEAGPARLTA